MTPSTPINILFCENNIDGTIGGSYFSLLYLVKGLDRSRYTPIVVFYTEHSLLPAFRDAGIETIIWPRTRAFTFGTSPRVPRLLRPLLAVIQKALNFVTGFVVPSLNRARFLRRRAIRIVHLNNSVLCNHPWMFAAMLARVRCVTHERGINERYPSLARYFGRRLDAVICISQAVRDNMRARGADFGNLLTIHNGLDPKMLAVRRAPDALRETFRLNGLGPIVVMIGNLRPWKGQETLVRAMARVRAVHPSARCLFVGATSPVDRDYETHLRSLVDELQLQDHVVFTGYQQNVADFLMLADVVVHASIEPEPFGRVILEAMACRKPVVASRAGAIPEIIDEGRTGLTFLPGDVEGLAEAIVQVTVDPDRSSRLGANGYQRLVQHFHITKNVEATERLYASLVAR